jgi:hypothetical protein
LLAFLVKAVNLGDLARLVVSTNERNLVGEPSRVSETILTSLYQKSTHFAFKHMSKVKVSKEK